jgi:hypothetical protein
MRTSSLAYRTFGCSQRKAFTCSVDISDSNRQAIKSAPRFARINSMQDWCDECHVFPATSDWFQTSRHEAHFSQGWLHFTCSHAQGCISLARVARTEGPSLYLTAREIVLPDTLCCKCHAYSIIHHHTCLSSQTSSSSRLSSSSRPIGTLNLSVPAPSFRLSTI